MYDVSLPVSSGSLIYPGDPPVDFESHQSIARGDPANLTRLSFGSHTGTHVDAPRHFIEGGDAVDQILPSRLVGPALVLHFGDQVQSIGSAELKAHDLTGHNRVLLQTRNSSLLERRDFVSDHCFLAPDGAEYLLARGVDVVGIDYLSIERFGSTDFPTHMLLLERGVVIIEGLDLRAVPPGAYQLVCLPLRLVGLDGAPARAILIAEP